MFDVEPFLAACDMKLSFLSADYGFSEVERLVEPRFLSVSYGNRKTGIKVTWEYGEQLVSVGIYSLADGQMFCLDTLIEMRVPEEWPPHKLRPMIRVEDAVASLSEEVRLLRTYAEDVLVGDSRVWPAVQKFMSRPWILKTIPGMLSQLFEPVKPGYVFAVQPSEGHFLFGRIIRVDAQVGKHPDLLLYYMYKAGSDDLASVPPLHRDDLLVPPIITGSLSPSLFRIVAEREIAPEDIVPQHCFKDSKGVYHDEFNNILPAATGPCGTYGAMSTKRINDAIADALTR